MAIQDKEPDAGHGGAGAPPDTHESNRAPDLTREYRNDEIAVRWYAKRCIHSAACIRMAPRVFDPRRRPWINLDAGDTQRIIAAVAACPTGALRYEGDGVPQRAPVAARLESKGVRARNAIAVIEVESHEVERAPVVLAAAASRPPRGR